MTMSFDNDCGVAVPAFTVRGRAVPLSVMMAMTIMM